ncbi:MAG: endo-1,4-beta-xylanase, partial [Dysgonamonadaceae bacterium]|nr:endo-1,4-beta-xylanase [Dysgonamonadaceae bacterium]
MNRDIINRLAKRFILLLTFPFITGMLACSSCSGNDLANNRENEKGKEIGSLREAPYPVGAALSIQSLKNKTAYRNTVIKEFGSITAENAMKMGCLSKGKDTYFWDDADYLVDFASTNGMRVHGHCLVWYKQSTNAMPTWIQNFQGSKEEWKQVMKEYIHTVVGRYKGKITSWDVVNEAIKDDGTFRTAEECIWTRNIGAPEYIDWAFQCAHEADPDALLFYNDFGHEYSSAKRTAVNNLIKGMQDRGIPVHGIGLQMHMQVKRELADIHT